MKKKEMKEILKKYNELWKYFHNDDFESINNVLLTNFKKIDIEEPHYCFKLDLMYRIFYQKLFWSLYYDIESLTD